MTMRMTVVLSALALAGCSLIGKGTATFGGGGATAPANAAPSGVGGPRVVADEDDPPHVRSVLEKLDQLEQLIAQRDFATYALEHRRILTVYLFQRGWEGERKHAAIGARLEALDAAAYKAFGGRLATLVGDGKRVRELDADAVEAADAAVSACATAASTPTTGRGDAIETFGKAVKTYEAALARVQKVDAQAFRYIGSVKGGLLDVPSKLMECEVRLADARLQLEDEYKPEVVTKTETERGCGMMEVSVRGVQLGAGTFATYTRAPGGASFAERMDCRKLPKGRKVPGHLARAVKEIAEHLDVKPSELVIQTAGAPSVEEDDDDLRLYRYQLLHVYSKKFQFAKNPCGDGKVFCEAGGSRGAAAYNRVEHALARAAAHAGKQPERCKTHLQEAKKQAEWFAQFRTDAIARKEWIAGATYKTKLGAKLGEKELVAAFAAKGQLADDRLLQKYCAKPPPRE